MGVNRFEKVLFFTLQVVNISLFNFKRRIRLPVGTIYQPHTFSLGGFRLKKKRIENDAESKCKQQSFGPLMIYPLSFAR